MDILKLPKSELHCHLDGSMNLEIVRELSGNPAIVREQLRAEPDCISLAEYLEKFELPIQCLQSEKGLMKAAYSLIEDVAKENLRYIEVRFAPMLSVHEKLSCRVVIESVIRGLKKGYEDFGVYSNVIVCAMRHQSPEQNLSMLKTARELLGEGVCAFDLAGDEAAFLNSGFRDLFAEAKRLDMPFTIHSGECGSVANVREAMELGARRIGHGVALMQDQSLIQEYARRRIGLEMCPTSNLQTKAIKNWDDYPLLDFLKHGVLLSVNTDNRTVSNTTITKELELVYKSCHQDGVIYQLLRNSIEMAFAADQMKHELLKELN